MRQEDSLTLGQYRGVISEPGGLLKQKIGHIKQFVENVFLESARKKKDQEKVFCKTFS